jgi:signal transduction histidine kinase/CheY-like chemotaxis protein/sugar lactone lactonase YvrE
MTREALRRWLALRASRLRLAALAAPVAVAAMATPAPASTPASTDRPAAGPAALTPQAVPERPRFRLFSPADGLPSSVVFKLALDRDNRLWVATLDGLARYDGVEFRVWRHDPADPGSLPGNDIQSVLVDRADRVWLAIQDAGIARYDPDRDRFERWRHDPADPASLPGDRIWTLAEDGAGGVWAAGYRTGLVRLHADGRLQAWRHAASDPASLCDDTIVGLQREDDDSLWIGSAGGLCRYRPGHGFERVPVALGRNGSVPMVLHVLRDRGRLWLSTHLGMRLLKDAGDSGSASSAVARTLGAGPDLPPELADVRGAASLLEPDGTLWFASSDGIRRWHPDHGGVQVYPARPGRALALPAPRFNDTLRDREGNLWFASEGGLAQLLPRWRAVRVYLPEPERPGGLPHGQVSSMNVDADGRLLLTAASQPGAFELDPVTGDSRTWFRDGATSRHVEGHMMTLLRDRAGRFWGGQRGRIVRYDPRTGSLRQIDRDRAGAALPASHPWRTAERADGTIFVAFGGGGLALIDGAGLDIRFDPLGAATGLPCVEIVNIRLDARQTAWLPCDNGVLRVAPDSDRVVAVDGAPAGRIDGLDFASDGTLWLHRVGQLEQYRIDGDALALLRRVGIEQGWPPFRAAGLAVDGAGQVWVTGPRGLYNFDPARGRSRRFDQDDGLASAEFGGPQPLLLGAHLLAAGTNAGPVVIDTRALLAPLPTARLRWHQASVLRNGQRIALAPGSTPWRLRHDDRDLRLAVRLNSLSHPAGHRYRFRLDGLDSGWIEQAGQPERLIERLASGEYRLRVQAFGADHQGAQNELVQTVAVALPPWRQPPALAGYALAIVLAMVALHGGQRRRSQRRQALLLAERQRIWAEQGSAAKTRFLAAVGHEIRTPMAGLLGMNALLLDSPLDGRQRHYARCVSQAGEHMLALVNDLLDLSRIEAGKLELDPGPVDLPLLLDELIADVEAAAERKGLRLSLRIDAGTPLAVVADGKRLKQVVLNFLANAIKFTASGRVRLLVSNGGDDGHLFAVEDDGPGLSDTLRRQLFEDYSQDRTGASTGGSGLGLAIARELAGLMGGKVGADNRAGGGSRFWLQVRLPRGLHTAAPARALPPLLLVDPDPVRADDLVESLAALGASARHVVPALAADSDSIVDGGDAAGAGAATAVGAGTGSGHQPGAGIGASADAASAAVAGTAVQAGTGSAAGAIALAAAASISSALEQLRRCGLAQLPRVLSLPLGTGLPPEAPRQRVLSGPWQPAAVLAACRTLWHGEVVIRPTPAPRDDLAGMRLLLVEDDPILREVLATRLAERAAQVVVAEHGLAALAQLQQATFDAMLLDLDLPHLDGLRLLELLHQGHGPACPPALIITARQQTDDLARCRAAGAVAFFRKPVDLDALTRRLQALRARSARGAEAGNAMAPMQP